MFKDPLLNKMLKETINKRWRSKHPGILSTAGSSQLGRRSKAYLIWKKYVLKRDGYKCIQCGSIKRLQVHHKKEWSKFRNQKNRFSVQNGITLCFNCHKQIHPWLKWRCTHGTNTVNE